MVRFLRIVCVSVIALIITCTLLLIQNSINLFEWITFSKMGVSLLVFSLIYLLLDDQRKSIIGKISLISSILASSILILSIVITSLNNYWNVIFGLIIFSFILVLYSKIKNKTITEKTIFLSSILIPIGIILNVENTIFYTFSGIILILLSGISLILAIKKNN